MINGCMPKVRCKSIKIRINGYFVYLNQSINAIRLSAFLADRI